MVILTWVCSFGTLVQTWRGKWGQFVSLKSAKIYKDLKIIFQYLTGLRREHKFVQYFEG